MARVKVTPEASIQLRHQIRTDQTVFAKSFFGWTPHQKQVEIFQATRNPSNKVITISAGRRGGGTGEPSEPVGPLRHGRQRGGVDLE